MTGQEFGGVSGSRGIRPVEVGASPTLSRRRSTPCGYGETENGQVDALRDPEHPTGQAPARSGIPSWARFVRIRKFAEITGYSERAVYMKIAKGVWIAGREYRRAPDGNICVDMEGYSLWVEGGQAPAYRR